MSLSVVHWSKNHLQDDCKRGVTHSLDCGVRSKVKESYLANTLDRRLGRALSQFFLTIEFLLFSGLDRHLAKFLGKTFDSAFRIDEFLTPSEERVAV